MNASSELTGLPEIVLNIVPRQKQGGKSTVVLTYDALGMARAQALFQDLKQLLLHANSWNALLSRPSASFFPTDPWGQPSQRELHTGDHLRIRIPGPPLAAGDGFDWVSIEQLGEVRLSDGALFYLRVRPSANPCQPATEIAHFLAKSASTCFILNVRDHVVSLAIISRNEERNTQVVRLRDRIRNFMVGVGAAYGLSKAQWSKLAKTLMKSSIGDLSSQN